jgi:RNA polymerase sigma factor (sigma-70 family)
MSPGLPTRLLATQSDVRLLALAQEGHERAFEALVLRYRRPLLRYCRRFSPADGRTEDVLQQALLQAWMALGRGVEVRDPRAWLYRIVHNAAINSLRDTAAMRAATDYGASIVEDGRLTAASEPDLARGLAVRETLAEMAALPPMQREVMIRTAVGGHSHEEVASDLGITDGAVRGLLYRARATLRTAMTAITPPPLLMWLAEGSGRGGQISERVAELAASGGAAGVGGLLVKGGVVAVTAGSLITTGAAVLQTQGPVHRRSDKTASASSSHRPAVEERLAAAVGPAPGTGHRALLRGGIRHASATWTGHRLLDGSRQISGRVGGPAARRHRAREEVRSGFSPATPTAPSYSVETPSSGSSTSTGPTGAGAAPTVGSSGATGTSNGPSSSGQGAESPSAPPTANTPTQKPSSPSQPQAPGESTGANEPGGSTGGGGGGGASSGASQGCVGVSTGLISIKACLGRH